MTITECKRLARLARAKGHFAVSRTVREYWCPLSLKAGDRPAHRVAVHHLPWADGPNVAAVDKAFVEHCTAHYPEDRCAHVDQNEWEQGSG